MAQLFSKGTIKNEVQSIAGLDIAEKIVIVQKLHTEWKNGNADDETRYEQNFNQLFFNELLGYTRNDHMHPKAGTPVGGKIADLGLGLFREGKYNFDDVQVVVELKGAKIFLDKKQNRQNPQSPVDQGFGYKTSFQKCQWLIVSNFHQIRLYRDNKQDYEERNIADLAKGDDNFFQLRKLLVLVSAKRLLAHDEQSHTERLLTQFRIEQQKITKKFYQDYKGLRLELINDMRHRNPDLGVELVVEKAQKIIDRLVFIHFCEDKGLLPADKLKENIIRAHEADFTPWEVLKKYFTGVDKGSEKLQIPNGYNGELFKPDVVLDALDIGDGICKKFIDLSNYDFDDELSVNILGHIFEQSISDLEELKLELVDDVLDSSLRSEGHGKRKKDGIFYTPEYIVDYIVQNSLMKYLSEKEDECLAKHKNEQKAYQAYQQILQNVKVLDPACGSGAFLVKVFDVLYAENERVGQLIGGLFDESDTYKNILTNNIYGVDLNPESVEITKLSLWLKSAQKGKKLNNLDKNIKCGNSLIDDPAVAGERAFDWKLEFKSIMDGGGFDVIVGNPPYVNIKGMDSLSRDYFFSSGKFISATYKTDLYAIFTEKSLSLIKHGGFLSFIMPYSWLSSSSFESLRRFILEDYSILELNILGQGVFQDANILTAICVFQKQKGIKNISLHDYRKTSNSDISLSIGSKKFETKIPLNFVLENRDLSIPIDIHTNEFSIIKKIDSRSSSVFDFEVDLGMNTADDLKYVSNQVTLFKNPKKVIEGKDFNRYSLAWNGAYVDYLPEDMIKNKSTARPGEPKRFEANKIILYRFVSKNNKLTATLDTENYYTLGSTYVIRGGIAKLKALLVLLNSSLIGFYISRVFSGSKITKNELEKLPLSFFDNIFLIDKADQMLALNKEFHEKKSSALSLIQAEYGIEKISRKLESFWELDFADFLKALGVTSLSLDKKEELMAWFGKKREELASLKSTIDQVDKEIDAMVYALYGLSEEEVKVVVGNG